MNFLSGVFRGRDKGKDAEATSGDVQSGIEEQAASQNDSACEQPLPMATNESVVQAPGKQKRVTVAVGLPDIDYPSPLMVRNTFIHYSCDDDQLGERTVRSCPNSAIMEPGVEAQHMPAIDEVPQLEAAPTHEGIQFETPVKPSTTTSGSSAEVDGSAKSRSTRAETSPSGSDEDGPESNNVASPAQVQEEQPALDGPAYVSSSGPGLSMHSTRLPDFEYPAPYFVTNTFIHAKLGREPSLDGFYHERQLASCPVSAIGGTEGEETPHAVTVAEAAAAAIDEEVANLPGGFRNPAWPFGSVCETPTNTFSMLPSDGGWPCPIPPPPVAPPVVAPPTQQQAASAVPPEPPAGLPAEPAAGSARAKKTPVLMLSEAVPQPAVGSSELPTVGSQAHRWGTCSPCAYAHSSRGCKNGVECPFCHLCDPGELKRRQKMKRMTQRRQAAAGPGQEFAVFPQM